MAKMRLSEAILAGSTLIHPKRQILFQFSFAGVRSGCALGMAGIAVGAIGGDETTSDVSILDSEFPVLREMVNLPCSCKSKKITKLCNVQYNLKAAIIHLFDNHVMSTSNTWTLEQLVDWVREIENATEEVVNVVAGKKEEFAEILEVMST